MTDRPPRRVLRVAHSSVRPGAPLSQLGDRLAGFAWDMVELDVLRSNGQLVVAHDRGDLSLPESIGFAEALAALSSIVGPEVRFDVDVKATGYETDVADAIAAAGIAERVLISSTHIATLRALRAHAPALSLGLSVPLARHNYLASPFLRPGALAMLAYLRRVLPGRVAPLLRAGHADAIMAHWGVVSDRLVAAVREQDAELFVWTVDDPARIPGLTALGVTGIISNRWDVFASLDA